MFFLALDEKIKKARNILWEYEINPYVGVENLCWAPNVSLQHSNEHIRIIADELINLYEEKRSRKEVVEYLQDKKKVAKDLWKNYDNQGEK